MGKIKAICISEKKGTEKRPVEEAEFIADWGIKGDAHGGTWHRQVSLLSDEKIQTFREKGAEITYGAFGENLVVEGVDFRTLPVGTRFRVGDVRMELTQIGKDCHSHCVIYQRMGTCIMPREGVFAKVLQGGTVRIGEELEVEMPDADRPFTAAVLTLSDSGAEGKREDRSGPLAAKMLRAAGYEVLEELLLSDDRKPLEEQLMRLADQRQVSLILTTGGTGFSERDQAPEATLAVCDRMARGIAEAIRGYSMTITKRSMFSRAESGIRGRSLIVNLPGSPKAVQESLEFILPELQHGLGVLRGEVHECARH